MRYIIERITEIGMICEDEAGLCREFPLALLPEGAKEGDILTESEDGFCLEREESAARREKIRRRLEELTE